MEERDAMIEWKKDNPEIVEILTKMQSAGQIHTLDSAVDAPELTILCGFSHAGILGAKSARCGCGKVVWLSPSTQTLIAKRSRPYTLLCPACALSFASAGVN